VVKVYEALFDPTSITTNKPADVKLRLLRRVAALELKADSRRREATITLDPYIGLASLVMARRHLGPKCTFTFKDMNSCRSDGTDTTCDRTLAACSIVTKRSGSPAGGNSSNFGGFVTIAAATA